MMGHKDPGQWRNNLLQLKELLQCASVNASVLRLDDLEHALQLPRVRGQFMLAPLSVHVVPPHEVNENGPDTTGAGRKNWPPAEFLQPPNGSTVVPGPPPKE
jgi:hypothetical protein